MNLQRILQDSLEIEQLMAERKAAQLEEGGEGQAAGEGAKEAGKKKVNGGSTRKKLVSTSK